MKKRLITIMIVIVAISGYFIYSLYPRAIIKDTDLIQTISVGSHIEDGGLHDITEQFDLDLLAETIANYKYKKVPKSYSPYQIKDVVFEIDFTYDHSPLHMVLGDINFVYTDASKGFSPIIDADKLLAEINLLFQ